MITKINTKIDFRPFCICLNSQNKKTENKKRFSALTEQKKTRNDEDFVEIISIKVSLNKGQIKAKFEVFGMKVYALEHQFGQTFDINFQTSSIQSLNNEFLFQRLVQ